MDRAIWLVLLGVGIVLIIYGISASNSFASDVSRFFSGKPTDKTIWLLVGGIAAAIVGVIGLMRGGRRV